MDLFEKFMSLDIDRESINLEKGTLDEPYFCYPENASVIGFEGSILYCTIKEEGETVFASNPETCADECVYPLAKNFEDFMRMVIACGSPTPIEQIIWMSREQFDKQVAEVHENMSKEAKAAIETIKRELNIEPVENIYDYVKEIQKDFDLSGIKFSDEYYEICGENPSECEFDAERPSMPADIEEYT